MGYVTKPHAGRLRVALCFPNTYYVGMSNLGFQTVYRLFNDHDDVVCERFFLPPKQTLAELEARGTRLVTLESQTPVADFDVIAFSVSFEWDYTNVVTLLRRSGLPLYAEERSEKHPLVVIGGAVTFVNPEPLALFADVVTAGEGESLVPDLVDAMRGGGRRSDVLRALAGKTGFYIPSFYTPRYDDTGRLAAMDPVPGTNAPPVVRKAAVKTTERLDPPHTTLFTPDTEFGSRFLIEVVRGCANLCRFCWAGYNYLPVRPFPTDRILELARHAKQWSSKAGLVSIALCDHPDIERILAGLAEMGYSISPGLAAHGRPDAVDRDASARERRAIVDDRARDRLGSPAPRHQQDRHQRRDPRARRRHLRQRHREPEALLHDRPPHRDRRGSREHPDADARHARADAGPRPPPRPPRTHRRQRQPAHPQARHRLPVAADGSDQGDRPQDRAAAQADDAASTTSTSRSRASGTRTTRRCSRSAIAASPRPSSPPSATAASGAPPSPKPASTPTSSSSATAARTPASPGTSSTAA